MAQLAQARAEEVGAAVLWCDGGSGGVSGVYGAGRGEGLNVVQVGNGGSWITHIGIPFDEHVGEKGGDPTKRTVYATLGDYGAILTLFVFVSAGWAIELAATRSMMARRTAGGQGVGAGDANGLWGGTVGRLSGGVRHAIEYVRGGRQEPDPQQVRVPVGILIQNDA